MWSDDIYNERETINSLDLLFFSCDFSGEKSEMRAVMLSVASWEDDAADARLMVYLLRDIVSLRCSMCVRLRQTAIKIEWSWIFTLSPTTAQELSNATLNTAEPNVVRHYTLRLSISGQTCVFDLRLWWQIINYFNSISTPLKKNSKLKEYPPSLLIVWVRTIASFEYQLQ